ncbi:zinc D-Ala-D-Ala carboxypeptidase [Kribbella orskensis]|uniref:Zinc D-Ala-D-Ala carboxypeptidase n=1 Tax=Kribbella orskensis TaxID=2512216 RepID=A0ABY2BKJ4_9ACTN|nr:MULTISPECIES: M15 family metallopeptidase [Kribbella]TCN40449.1 zinc D-Ala-D-Ala carboxypeptidase [Kribbella sp. VKM Ac-2500]TCO23069.1 zinc D-Ala-D-Ala carboxypeptidase [Kribbella orskensis]
MSFLKSLFSKPLPRVLAVLSLFAAMLGATVVTSVVTATEAHADGCYTWSRTLSQGASGEDVRQLQIRVAGYPAYGGHIAADGAFGPATKAAVQRFQSAYGLGADGIAGPATFSKIYSLQDDDCTPIHFAYTELDDGCGGSGWDGGPLSAAATKANALQTMWQLEAMRHALGDQPLNITSGFRSIPCNNAVGGASNSQHLYGRSADLVGSPSLCTLAKQARYHGFGGIFGPGYPGHNDHTHVDIRTSNAWSAPTCGI